MNFSSVDVSKLNSKVQNGIVENEKQKVNLGKLGAWFGCAEQARFNIVGVLVLSAVIMLVVCLALIWFGHENQAFISGLFSIVNTSLGYMFGRKT